MTQVVKKQLCRCENCGNEAEMTFTCSLQTPPPEASGATQDADSKRSEPKAKVKATGTCAHCGNEADMWIDL